MKQFVYAPLPDPIDLIDDLDELLDFIIEL